MSGAYGDFFSLSFLVFLSPSQKKQQKKPQTPCSGEVGISLTFFIDFPPPLPVSALETSTNLFFSFSAL